MNGQSHRLGGPCLTSSAQPAKLMSNSNVRVRFSVQQPSKPPASKPPAGEASVSGEATKAKSKTKARMKIGELARKTGKTVRALHLYEELGLLSPERSDGGFRLYGSDELARVYWISKLQDMGFKLNQIRGLLDAVAASHTAPDAMHGVRELFQSKLRDTREQIQKLLHLERDISESLSYLEACRSCGEISVEACMACDEERHGGLPEPTLVSGIHIKRGDEKNKNEEVSP